MFNSEICQLTEVGVENASMTTSTRNTIARYPASGGRRRERSPFCSRFLSNWRTSRKNKDSFSSCVHLHESTIKSRQSSSKLLTRSSTQCLVPRFLVECPKSVSPLPRNMVSLTTTSPHWEGPIIYDVQQNGM